MEKKSHTYPYVMLPTVNDTNEKRVRIDDGDGLRSDGDKQ